jgi:hypothetical protein
MKRVHNVAPARGGQSGERFVYTRLDRALRHVDPAYAAWYTAGRGVPEKRGLCVLFVTLSVAKGLTNPSRGQRFFASLRMTVGMALFQQPCGSRNLREMQ